MNATDEVEVIHEVAESGEDSDDDELETSTQDEASPRKITIPAKRHEPASKPISIERTSRDRGANTAVGACLLVVAAVVLGVQWLRRGRKGKNSKKAFDYTKLIEPTPSLVSSGSGPLAGCRIVFSGLLDVEKQPSKYTNPEQSPRVAVATASALQKVLEAGATVVGRSTTEELRLGLLAPGDEPPSPVDSGTGVSGTGSGAAAAVAAGLADVALGVDHLFGLRVQAAQYGLYCCRATRRTAPLNGAVGVGGDLDSIAWASQNPSHILTVGKALLPKDGVSSATELIQVIVADELFMACGCFEMEVAFRAALGAARQWAPDNAARADLLTYLTRAVPAAQHFVDEEDKQVGVMKGIRRAAQALERTQFLDLHGHHLQDLEAAPSGVAAELEQASAVTDSMIADARDVQAQVVNAFREILRTSILIVPTSPGYAPSNRGRDRDKELEWTDYEQALMSLSSFAALGGFPQVCIPVPIPTCPSASVSLLGLAKTDLRLISTAVKLGPLIARAAPEVAAQIIAEAEEEKEEAAGKNGEATSEGKPEAKKVEKPTRAQAAPEAGVNEEAEALKAKGNTFFKQGDYPAAVGAYTQALEMCPLNPIYYNNRAAALLKMMRFKEAEGDCSMSLKIELNPKAVLRRGVARRGLDKLEEAERDFEQVLRMEPKNRQAREELAALKALAKAKDGTIAEQADSEAAPMEENAFL